MFPGVRSSKSNQLGLSERRLYLLGCRVSPALLYQGIGLVLEGEKLARHAKARRPRFRTLLRGKDILLRSQFVSVRSRNPIHNQQWLRLRPRVPRRPPRPPRRPPPAPRRSAPRATAPTSTRSSSRSTPIPASPRRACPS